MFCPKCGKELKEGAQFCGSCGARVEAAAPAPEGAPPAAVAAAPAAAGVAAATIPVKKKNPIAIIGAVAAVVVVVIVGVVVYNAFFAPYEIDEEHFPDASFRSYVSAKCDTDNDGKLSRDEAAAVEYMGQWNAQTMTYDGGLNSLGISDLAGIELFPNLKGISSSSNTLTDVDLSSNNALEYVVMDCDSLKYLNVTGADGLQAVQVNPQTEVKGLSDSMVKNTLVKSADHQADYTKSFTYDYAGHLLNATRVAGTQTTTDSFTWDGDRLVNSTDDGAFIYDEEGRLTELDGDKYSYDDNGRLAEIIKADQSFETYAYDNAGRITAVSKGKGSGEEGSYTVTDDDRAASAVVLTIAYNDAGLVTAANYSNNEATTTFTYEYDGMNNLTKANIVYNQGRSTYDFTYTYDESGRLTQSTYSYSSLTTRCTYSYNEKGQMTGATTYSSGGSSTSKWSYNCDNYGNISSYSYTGYSNSGSRDVTYEYLDVYVPREIGDYGALTDLYELYQTDSLEGLCMTARSYMTPSIPLEYNYYPLATAYDFQDTPLEFVLGYGIPRSSEY